MWPAALAGPELADMLAATRQLLGAWDATLSRWNTAPRPPPAPATPGERPPRLPARDGLAPAAPVQPAPPVLSVQMLDGFQIWIGERPLQDLPHGKARALLMWLLLHRRRPLARQRLAGLFWPEAETAAARNSLNVTLHRLRRALGDPALLRHDDQGYRIAGDGETWIDVEHFEQQAALGEAAEQAGRPDAAAGHYEIAATLYRTDLVDENETERALQMHAQTLRDRLNQVLERLSDLREGCGDLHGCVRATQRHLGLDECNEAAHARLMRCYARLGQPQLAERQYRQCVGALRRQLDLPPGEALTALYRRIGRREPI